MNDLNARIQTIIGGVIIENAALKLQVEQLQARLAEAEKPAAKASAKPNA